MLRCTCKMCGGEMNVGGDRYLVTCEYCGTPQTISHSTDEVVWNLFERANFLRRQCEFDKAEELYNVILEMNPQEPEAYWGILLCKSGTEYVEDPRKKVRIPTCHRTMTGSILLEPAYKEMLEYAEEEQRQYYREEAEKIDEIQKSILEVVRSEEDFDVFICYKQSDENDLPTEDSVIGRQLYEYLSAAGIRTFFAAVTLENKLGAQFEPLIFSALNSARVMLVIGTKAEYMDAVWVKNEWYRFLKLMQDDESRCLIPCYRGMDIYDMPDVFLRYQAQNMAAPDAFPKILETVTETLKQKHASLSVNDMIEQASMLLELEDFEGAYRTALDINKIDPHNGDSFLLMMMADLKIPKENMIPDVGDIISNNANYVMAMKYGDEDLKRRLAGYQDIVLKRQRYKMGMQYLEAKSYAAAARMFSSIPGYMDADAKAAQAKRGQSMYGILLGVLVVFIICMYLFIAFSSK